MVFEGLKAWYFNANERGENTKNRHQQMCFVLNLYTCSWSKCSLRCRQGTLMRRWCTLPAWTAGRVWAGPGLCTRWRRTQRRRWRCRRRPRRSPSPLPAAICPVSARPRETSSSGNGNCKNKCSRLYILSNFQGIPEKNGTKWDMHFLNAKDCSLKSWLDLLPLSFTFDLQVCSPFLQKHYWLNVTC